jgi:hypothetical protein
MYVEEKEGGLCPAVGHLRLLIIIIMSYLNICISKTNDFLGISNIQTLEKKHLWFRSSRKF